MNLKYIFTILFGILNIINCKKLDEIKSLRDLIDESTNLIV